MPSIRVGFSTDLNITGGLTGIGTTNPAARLDVAGQITVKDIAGSGGVTTFREYQGFSQVQTKIVNNTLIDNNSGGPFSSLAGEIKITGETTVSSGSTVEVGKTKTLTVTDRFAVPLGETNNRDNTPEPGTTRFNQDFGTLEFFDGANWKTVNSYARPGGGGRGIYAGGYITPTTAASTIDSIRISTLGNATVFGDLTENRYSGAGMSNSVTGIFAGGWVNPANDLDVYYVTIASEGNAIDFGVDSSGGWGAQGTSSSTRGLSAGGNYPTGVDTIDSFFFATKGAKVDYGDLKGNGATNNYRGRSSTGCNSPTRSLFFGGYNPAYTSVIESKITASDGNTVFFGDLTSKMRLASGVSGSTRGVVAGGENPNSDDLSEVQYITLSTFGNAQYFGDLGRPGRRGVSGVSTLTRGVFAGGGPTRVNSMSYITITSAGTGIDFGDLSNAIGQPNTASDSHGGLGGF